MNVPFIQLQILLKIAEHSTANLITIYGRRTMTGIRERASTICLVIKDIEAEKVIPVQQPKPNKFGGKGLRQYRHSVTDRRAHRQTDGGHPNTPSQLCTHCHRVLALYL